MDQGPGGTDKGPDGANQGPVWCGPGSRRRRRESSNTAAVGGFRTFHSPRLPSHRRHCGRREAAYGANNRTSALRTARRSCSRQHSAVVFRFNTIEDLGVIRAGDAAATTVLALSTMTLVLPTCVLSSLLRTAPCQRVLASYRPRTRAWQWTVRGTSGPCHRARQVRGRRESDLRPGEEPHKPPYEALRTVQLRRNRDSWCRRGSHVEPRA